MKHYLNLIKKQLTITSITEYRGKVYFSNNRGLSIVRMTMGEIHMTHSDDNSYEVCFLKIIDGRYSIGENEPIGWQTIDQIQNILNRIKGAESVLTTYLHETEFEEIDETLQNLI